MSDKQVLLSCNECLWLHMLNWQLVCQENRMLLQACKNSFASLKVGKLLWHLYQHLQTSTVLLLMMVRVISDLDTNNIYSSWIKTALLVYTVRSCLYMQNSWKAYESHHQCLKKTEILTACCLMEYDLWIARKRNSMYGKMKAQLQ